MTALPEVCCKSHLPRAASWANALQVYGTLQQEAVELVPQDAANMFNSLVTPVTQAKCHWSHLSRERLPWSEFEKRTLSQTESTNNFWYGAQCTSIFLLMSLF